MMPFKISVMDSPPPKYIFVGVPQTYKYYCPENIVLSEKELFSFCRGLHCELASREGGGGQSNLSQEFPSLPWIFFLLAHKILFLLKTDIFTRPLYKGGQVFKLNWTD